MAAHVFTALKQIKEDIEKCRVVFKHLEAACNLSCWTESLDVDEWQELLEIATTEDIIHLHRFVSDKLIHYQAEWERLGRPATREEWVERLAQMLRVVQQDDQS